MFRIIPHRALIEPKAEVRDVEAGDGSATATVHIEGLLCSACAANVRSCLEGLDGVSEAVVDLDTGEARVVYDPARARPEDLVGAVEGAVILRPLRRLLAKLSGHQAAQRRSG